MVYKKFKISHLMLRVYDQRMYFYENKVALISVNRVKVLLLDVLSLFPASNELEILFLPAIFTIMKQFIYFIFS